jgi:cytochrome c553
MLKKALLITAAALFTIVVVGLPAMVGIRPFIGPRARALTDRKFEPTPARLERGKYLTSTGQAPCVLCHSPMQTTGGGLSPVPGLEFSGRNWAPEQAPFATAKNLTPDPETGIGTYTDDQLARSIREGITHDGRTMFPIMPYDKFRAMTDEDLASIVVFLRSLKPIRHEMPPTAVPFPVSRLINSLPQPLEGPVTADLSTPQKRGEHIVRMSACADCHTTHDGQGNAVEGMDFAGGTALPYEGRKTVYSANLTPAVNGIPYYTEELFLETLHTGKVRSRQLDDFMPWKFFGKMTDEDLKDIFAYLKTLKPVEHFVDNTAPPTKCPRCGLVHGGGERNKKKA